jgi:hypothetical protein
MILRLFVILFWGSLVYSADFNFPGALSESDASLIVREFNSGFLMRMPGAFIGEGNYQSQGYFRTSFIDTSRISKLGTTSTPRDVQIHEFGFAKKLPFGFELGAQTSVSILDNDVHTYGGFARWGFYQAPLGQISVVAHGSSANFDDLISTNVYGSYLSYDVSYEAWKASVGTGLVRTTNGFDRNLFGTTGDFVKFNIARNYSHSLARIAYQWNQMSLAFQTDWMKTSFSSVELAYFF